MNLDAVISGVGSYLPARRVTNDDLAKIVDTSDEWIRSRSGIGARHFAAEGEAVSDMGAAAARAAMVEAGVRPEDIGFIVLATVTGDKTFPASAVYIQEKLGVPACPAFDVSAACGGFIYALSIAQKFIASGEVKHALVIGAEKLSCFLDWTDRSTCVLFGDGAGAVVLSGEPAAGRGVVGTHISADGRLAKHLYSDGGPSTTATVGKARMNGKEVFRNAVEHISNSVIEVARKSNVRLKDIDWFVPHQANIRIIEACAKRLDLDNDRIIVTIDRHANTSAASIPLALDAGIKDGRIKRGQLLAFAALGGGLAWGAALVRY